MNAKLKELTEDQYEEQLNDCYETVTICGMEYEQGRALRELDPVAFRCGMADEPEVWICDECDDEHETEEEAEECCKEDEE